MSVLTRIVEPESNHVGMLDKPQVRNTQMLKRMSLFFKNVIKEKKKKRKYSRLKKTRDMTTKSKILDWTLYQRGEILIKYIMGSIVKFEYGW